ncbi:MAG TPA: 1-acyl-sn-glycerol-3-phosphate acyltransferase [Vicinamibacterales bacterium]|nr:1-acyl-sn-glycerol-3-phosphate acyltransferase [Vicinamibacterales bacterium]
MTTPDGASEPFARTWPMARVIMPAARLMSYYFRARVSGIEHLPHDRPVIYVGKHPRTFLYLETILLGLYTFWDSGRPPVRVLEQTGTSLHRAPVLGWVRRHVNAIPASAAHALAALGRGESVLIFPGGTRELYGPPDELQWKGRRGFARIAIRSGAPVVPFAILGADRQHLARVSLRGVSLWLPPFPLPVRLDFRFGRPIIPPDASAAGGESAEQFAARVETATRALLAAKRPQPPATRPASPQPAAARAARRDEAETSAAVTDPAAARPAAHELDPRRWRYRFGYLRLASWLSRYHRVRFEGAPWDGPCIYVAHHGAGYLSADLAIAVYQLAWRAWFEERGRLLTLRIAASKGNPLERAIPGLAALKRNAGLIDPSEQSCLAVLERGDQLLITPGGHRESSPRARGYRLRWNERYGFVRLALRTGVPIVPLAVVGGYAAYPGFAVGKLSFWSPLPLPARLDIAVGQPIEIPRQPARARDLAIVKPLHQEIREATQALYDRLLARRAGTAR